MSYDPSKSVWLNPNIMYLFDNSIIECDIRDAGFNLIKQYKLLPKEKIIELEKLGKGEERHIAIGKLQRNDKELSIELSNRFADIRAIFIAANKIGDDDIVSVKKDAIYTIGECSKLRFGNINFIPKNKYTSYIRLPNIHNLELYYSSIDGTIDIKGMGDSAVNRHRLYMLEFIKEIIQLIENKDSRVHRKMRKFIMDYKSGELEDEYYVEFNNISKDINPIFNYSNILIPFTQIILKEMS